MKTAYLLGAVILVTLLTACSGNNQTNFTEAEAVKIQASILSLRDVDQLGTFTATVQAEATNNIAPQVSSRIKKVYAEVGDHVRSGQKLAEMDDSNLTQVELQLDNARIEFGRVDELYKVGGISRSNWDAAKLSYDLAKTSYDNLQENTWLISPITGLVTQRNYDSGDMYAMGSPLYVVEQIKPVKIIVHVSESLFTKVKKGMEVDVVLDVYGNEVFKGTVSLAYPSIDPGSRTFPVEIRIGNADERVRPGMFARVTFNYGSESRVVIPDRAIQKQSGSAERYVYVIENGMSQYRKITLGRRIGDEFEVLEGISEGEVVAVTGQNRLDTGTKVETVHQ
ncbi:MAG: efflux RND transporter periplasmic adaptor subunit [Bacteroidales bacterium]|jgi:RND family efflux transporter MFP subunit|nr:efflux RND transporter periplasmic adaptor subunit [Bacteroidales bacterium]